MKRSYKIYGILATAAILLFAVYQLLFLDRRSRLHVDASKRNELHYIKKASESRKLIREGQLYFEVNSLAETKKTVERLAADFEGYISSEIEDEEEGKIKVTQTIRIPEAAVDEFTHSIESLANKIEYKRLEVSDVTEEFIDLESRLLTKKKMEARYLEIIKGAKTIKDIMDIETQIGTVRAEIESMDGRLKYLSNNVAFGTISLQFHERGASIAGGYGGEIVIALRNGWKGLLAVVALLVTVWPLVMAASIATWFYFRRKRVTLIQ